MLGVLQLKNAIRGQTVSVVSLKELFIERKLLTITFSNRFASSRFPLNTQLVH